MTVKITKNSFIAYGRLYHRYFAVIDGRNIVIVMPNTCCDVSSLKAKKMMQKTYKNCFHMWCLEYEKCV